MPPIRPHSWQTVTYHTGASFKTAPVELACFKVECARSFGESWIASHSVGAYHRHAGKWVTTARAGSWRITWVGCAYWSLKQNTIVESLK